MKTLHPQYVVDGNQNRKSVILPIEEWQDILNAMEELDDIRVYDDAKNLEDEILPFEQAVEEMEKDWN